MSTTQHAKSHTHVDPETREQFAAVIGAAWEHTGRIYVEGIIAIGQHLIAAKSKISHGDYEAMIAADLPFSPSTARRIVAIARHPVLSKRSHANVLPPSWNSLYVLTQLPDAVVEAKIQDGTITPKMERKDVTALKVGTPSPHARAANTIDAVDQLTRMRGSPLQDEEAAPTRDKVLKHNSEVSNMVLREAGADLELHEGTQNSRTESGQASELELAPMRLSEGDLNAAAGVLDHEVPTDISRSASDMPHAENRVDTIFAALTTLERVKVSPDRFWGQWSEMSEKMAAHRHICTVIEALMKLVQSRHSPKHLR